MPVVRSLGRGNYTVVGIVGVVLVLASLAQSFGLLASWQEAVWDRFFIARAAPNDIVIIGIDDESIAALGGWPFARATFVTALSHLGAPKSVGIDVAFVDPSPRGAGDDQALANFLTRSAFPVVLPLQYDDRGGKIISPLALFSAQTNEGYVNVILEHGGVVRRFLPQRGSTESFAVALIAAEASAPSYPSTVRIDYQGKEKTFLTIPFIDVYRGTAPTSLFDNNIVLIGVTAKDLHDTLQTPLGTLPGVEVHANALNTLQKGRYFTDLPFFVVLVCMLVLCTLAALTVVRVKRLPILLGLLLLELIVPNLLAALAFSRHILVPNLSISVAFLVVTGGLLIYQYGLESREKRRIRHTFQYYLMPEVIDQLVAHPEKLRLGGEERVMTVLFSDIRGFTAISEALSAEGLTALVNEYLTLMTDCIMERHGLVDKYIGDAIMAFWGAPLENTLQASDAAHCVLDMAAALTKANGEWKARALPPINIGIGLNTGKVIVGNMGSAKRFNYTVMGDEVNLSSRLQGLNKEYGTQCIESESTRDAIVDDPTFCIRELDVVVVKGKTAPKKIFELVTGGMTDARRALLGG